MVVIPLVLFLFLYYTALYNGCVNLGGNNPFSSWINLDTLAEYLIVLTVMISVSVIFCSPWLTVAELLGVCLSNVFASVCYVCVHSFFFWFFYELSMLVLLFLILWSSPYSERFSAFWYFLGYLLCSGLPLLVVVLIMAEKKGDYSLLGWELCLTDYPILLLLGVIFFTKVPVFPFHSWLPVVHAESSSIVSVCLSGYVMKLGVLGLVRFCSRILSVDLFVDGLLLFFLILSLFYFGMSLYELDNKRWLAFLSLAHISLIPVFMKVCEIDSVGYLFMYCLAHGLSASLGFIFFWYLSSFSGGRSWFVMKNGLVGSHSSLLMIVLMFCICGSFPFTLQFFVELWSVGACLNYNVVILIWMGFYIYLGGLVPIMCIGYLLCRFRDVVSSSGLLKSLGIIVFFFVSVCVLCYLFL